MGTRFDAVDPLGEHFLGAIGDALEQFIDTQREVLAGIGPELATTYRLTALFTAGGKRLRPAFCYWGRVAAGGAPDDERPLLRAAASLDLLHVSALVHDDVMDDSATRRGVPAAHLQFADQHRAEHRRGDAEAFGRAGAILLGDLLLMWSAQLFTGSGLSADELARALPLLDAMRTEVTCGQLLDVIAQGGDPMSEGVEVALDEANRVVEFKSARYSVTRPVQIGAALAGADTALLSTLSRYGSPLGRAFQFRDDVLGVFGDPDLTGKPAGDDIREGKRTVLVAHTLGTASPSDARRLDDLLGHRELTEADVADAMSIIERSGARTKVERMIDAGHDQALEALHSADITAEGRAALVRLAELCVRRNF